MRKENVPDIVIECTLQTTRPGKFEGEQRYTPFYYDAWLNGSGENIHTEHGFLTVFEIQPGDKNLFNELRAYKFVTIHEDGNGFVYANEFENQESLDKFIQIALH